ncbi:nitroreductase [Candidatus Marinamargulisbacteria bacterium SCGC AG-439-L15]|nr:nitroreductase [Candidatus Marinamargulisbacteria bacterium SCGC AG-439-L15]
MKPEILRGIKERHCKRAFLNKPVPKDTINDILQIAGNAASSKNSQPWQVAIITGKTKDTLSKKMCEQFDKGASDTPDYTYMTDPTPPHFKDRARDCGYRLFELKGIDKNDHNKRKAHFRENYTFFGAPVALIFHLHPKAEPGNFLDIGLFMQNVMLGCIAYDLGSCPQFSITSYTNTIKSLLTINKERIIVCGMAIGYPDPKAKVNSFIPPRLTIENYSKWFD